MEDRAVQGDARPAPGPATGHIPALDGLRAVAIAAVLLFHHGVGWAAGGYLGVDLFFVLSGFLISGKLLDEHSRHGRIRLWRFWTGRVRRLLPAMLLMLAGVALYTAAAAEPVAQRSIRGDVLSSLVYLTNWRFIVSDVGYFAGTAAPSPVRHLWSLAVEEQFYVLFPLILIGLTAVSRRRRALTLAIGTLVLVSAGWTAWLAAAGASTTRLYEGTDTRLATILTGTVAALLVRRQAARTTAPRLLRAASAAALVVLATIGAVARGDADWMYPTGTLVFAVAAAVVVAAAATLPRAGWVGVLGSRPMVAVGAISYGIYLWHWPVYLYLTPDRMGFGGAALLALRVAVSITVAAVSFGLVEQPIRNQRFRMPAPGLVTAGAMVSVAALIVAATAGAPPGDQMAARTGPAPVLTAPSVPDEVEPFENDVDPALVPPAAPRDRPLRLALVGDSVAASLHFYQPHIPELELSASTTIGCGIMAPAIPVETGELNPDCPGWRDKWAKALGDDPDIVAIVLGAWEIKEHRLNGRSLVPSGTSGTAAADPATDPTGYVDDRIDEAVSLVQEHTDARIAFVELACAMPRDLGVGRPPLPQTRIELVDWFNSRLAAAARRHPGLVQVVSINQHVCPDGEPLNEVDGVELRYDGIHWSEDGGPIAWAWLLSELFEAAYRPAR